MRIEPKGLVVSILCVDDDLQRFCRRLVSIVNHGPMHLARVVATGSQIYPTRSDTIRDSATLLRCEFRMRNTGTTVDENEARKLLDRIAVYQVLDSHLVDESGVNIGPVDKFAAAS